jgi:ATP-dependent helicase HrpB
MACPLEEDWLTEVLPGSVRVEEVAEFVRDRGTVVVRRRRMFGAVVLEERSGGTPDPAIVLECFVAELRRDLWHYLGPNKELRSWLARLEWLRSQRPGDPLPEIAEADIAEAAASLCVGKSRIADLRKAPVLSVLKQSLTPSQQATLSRDAPSSVDLPSGRRVRIDYTSGSEPFVAARIQEFFGMRETPRLAGGRVPLLLHLLAPNRRPVQITTDLASFWKDVYPVERLALRRRYPKHDWPGDPSAPSG